MASFSIIVPVFQAEKYLKRCLESLRKQTHSDFEVIMIDDGSTDNSYQICCEYQEMDKRFSVIHQTNQGVSYARNIGLEVAKKDYIIFVDSDDYVSDRYLELLNDILKNGADICILTKYFLVCNGKNVLSEYVEYAECKDMNEQEQVLTYLIGYAKQMPLGVLSISYKREFLEQYQIRFDVNYIYGEDADFSLKALFEAKKIAWLKEACYFYNKDNENSATSKVSYIGLKSSLEVYKKWYYYCCERNDLLGKRWAVWFSNTANACLILGNKLEKKDRVKLFEKDEKSLKFYSATSEKLKKIVLKLYLLFGYENVVVLAAWMLKVKNSIRVNRGK